MPQACNTPPEVQGAPNRKSALRLAAPYLLGATAAGLLVLLYVGTVTWAQDWSHTLGFLSADWPYVAAIAGGFGLQVGLYGYLRLVVHHTLLMAAPAAATGVGTGTSSVAMVACCIHHVTDVLPAIGLSGVSIFLGSYREPLMLAGVAANVVGIAIMLRVVRQGRLHLRMARAASVQAG
ncbi:MAG: hypothetical protein HY680_06335 [Chloroflexi bacterium]|nr:hypothetical protein [Chloroflexota bacterium]